MATTYTTTFDLAEARTGVSGHYPLKVLDSDYTPDNTIYAKVGDKVKFVVSEPSPDSGNVSYNNTNVADTDPDPDEFTDDGTTNQTSPSSWEYTITSAAEDSTFQWWYFGNTFYNTNYYRQQYRTTTLRFKTICFKWKINLGYYRWINKSGIKKRKYDCK